MISTLGDLRHNVAITFNRCTSRAINALNPFDSFFNTNTDTLFHLYRRCTKVWHPNPNDGYVEHWKLFLVGDG